MLPLPPLTPDEHGSRLRLRTIIRLRWIAVLGQAATVAAVYFILGFDFPVGLCALVISLSAWLNIYLAHFVYSGAVGEMGQIFALWAHEIDDA